MAKFFAFALVALVGLAMVNEAAARPYEIPIPRKSSII